MVLKVTSLPKVLLQPDKLEDVKNYLASLPLDSQTKRRILMEWGKMFDKDLKEEDYIEVTGEKGYLWK